MYQGVSDRVYHELRDLIRSGEIAPGARIPNERILMAPTWPQSKEEIYAFARLYYQEAGNGFLLWTFEQIVSAR